jgi:hypothetical protein
VNVSLGLPQVETAAAVSAEAAASSETLGEPAAQGGAEWEPLDRALAQAQEAGLTLGPAAVVLCARFATAARLDAAALRAWALFRDTPPRARGCEDYAAMIRAFGAVGNVDAAVGLLKVRLRRRPAQ